MKLTQLTTYALIICLTVVVGCREDLPGAGSIDDLTPPSADFTFGQFSPSNYLEVTFSNLSESSTDFEWDFGDGNTSTEEEPTHIYETEGTYQVTLVASDKLDVSSTVTKEITLTEPSAFIPPIWESGFENGQLPDGTGDGRDSWRNSDLGGVIQITSDPVLGGVQAAKLTGVPSDPRIGYQLLTVTPNTTYDVTFNYTMLDDQPGWLIVSILDGPYTDHEEALGGVIGSVTVNNQNSPDAYVQEVVTFNSGENSEIAIYFYNEGTVETRLDDFSINIGTGTVPPSASFSYEADEMDQLTIDFMNSSLNATSYEWDFGDGNTSNETNPSHTYATAGLYTVQLTASNSDQDAVFSADIIVAGPVAEFTSAANPDNYLEVQFTNSSSNADSYAWDFGDGSTSFDENPVHTYTEDGTYTVTLVSSNTSEGLDDETTSNINIFNPMDVSINNPSLDDFEVNNDNREAWRNSTLEASGDVVFGDGSYVLQMSSTARTGNWAGKLPTLENSSEPQRWMYQVIDVDANTNYAISAWIRNKAADVGSNVNFAIYDGPFDDAAVVFDSAFIIADEDFNSSTGHDTNEWTEATIEFNSGDNTEVVLFITNDFSLTAVDSETFLDDFSIVEQ